jgi:hypothetical protein
MLIIIHALADGEKLLTLVQLTSILRLPAFTPNYISRFCALYICCLLLVKKAMSGNLLPTILGKEIIIAIEMFVRRERPWPEIWDSMAANYAHN